MGLKGRTGNSRTAIQRGGLSGKASPRGKGSMSGDLSPKTGKAGNSRTSCDAGGYKGGASIPKKPEA